MNIKSIKGRGLPAPPVPLKGSRVHWQGKLASVTYSECVPNGMPWSWFDIPNPWTTDASGFLFFAFTAWGSADVAVSVGGVNVYEVHVADHIRELKGCVWVPRGLEVRFGTGSAARLVYWRFMRE